MLPKCSPMSCNTVGTLTKWNFCSFGAETISNVNKHLVFIYFKIAIIIYRIYRITDNSKVLNGGVDRN